MKAIGIKMVDLQPMSANEACIRNYKTNGLDGSQEGYEVTYPDGYKSWCPKEIADKAYFKLSDENGDKVTPADISNFIAKEESVKIGTKTTNTTITTITGYEVHGQSSCVKAENFSLAVGAKFAKPHAIDQIWQGLGFVLQWAKYGLTYNDEPEVFKYLDNMTNKEYNKPDYIKRLENEYLELDDKCTKLAKFIGDNPIYNNLSVEEKKDMLAQLDYMRNYRNILVNRLKRVNSDIVK